MRIKLTAKLAVLIGILFVSCIKKASTDSYAKHNASSLPKSLSPFMWAEVDAKQFLSMENLPEGVDSNLKSKLTVWVDQIHKRARLVFPNLQEAPHPVVALVKDFGNAAAAPTMVCLGDARSGLRITFEGEITGDKGTQCIEPVHKIDLTSFVQAYNEIHTSCTLEVKGTEVWTASNCLSFGAMKVMAYKAASNVIMVGTDLQNDFGSDALWQFVISHELAHYYLAHTSIKDLPNYFYRLTKRSQSERPTEDPTLNDLGRKLVNHDLFFKQEDNLHYHQLALWLFADQVVGNRFVFCSQPSGAADCKSLCDAASQFIPPVTSEQIFGNWDASAAESALTACSKAMIIKDDSMRIDIANRFHLSSQQAQPATTAEDLMRIASNYLNRAYQDQESLYAMAKNEDLGWYTYEQEADEYGLQFASWIGQVSSDLPSMILNSAFAADIANQRPQTISLDQCRVFMNAGWKDQDGNPMFITTTLDDAHHNICYRVYNLWKELKAHEY